MSDEPRLTDTPNPQAEPTPVALPTGPIPMAGYDQIIEEGWGDSVAQSLNNLTERKGWLTFTPGDAGTPSTINAPTSGAMTTWLTVTELFVPDWANMTLVRTEIQAVHDSGTGPNTYDVQLKVGSVTSGRIVRQTAPVATGLWFPVIWSCLIDLTILNGYQQVEILARRVAGSGNWVADGFSAVAIEPSFMGAIGWYGD